MKFAKPRSNLLEKVYNGDANALTQSTHEVVNLIRSEETVDPAVDLYDTSETIYDLLHFRETLLNDRELSRARFQRSSTIECLARGLYLVHELYTETTRIDSERNERIRIGIRYRHAALFDLTTSLSTRFHHQIIHF